MANKKLNKNYILWLLIFIPYLLLIPAIWYYNKMLNDIHNANFVVISKQDMNLKLYNYKGTLLQECMIACGKNTGNKDSVGDLKTPEGVFTISDIENASTWEHDFKDGKGKIAGAYGPFFIRLNVPNQKGIGIHGTHNPSSIGTRATEGCIRLPNDELKKLVKKVNPSTVVIVTPSQGDIDATILKKMLGQMLKKKLSNTSNNN